MNEECVAAASNRRFYNPSLDLYMLPKKMYAMGVILFNRVPHSTRTLHGRRWGKISARRARNYD